jgi:hypothetical protein
MRWVLWLSDPKTFKTKKELTKYCVDNSINVYMFGKIPR